MIQPRTTFQSEQRSAPSQADRSEKPNPSSTVSLDRCCSPAS